MRTFMNVPAGHNSRDDIDAFREINDDHEWVSAEFDHNGDMVLWATDNAKLLLMNVRCGDASEASLAAATILAEAGFGEIRTDLYSTVCCEKVMADK